ncbi:MAG: GNAT family N-acetyltransferase [Pseudomonadota bacterium]
MNHDTIYLEEASPTDAGMIATMSRDYIESGLGWSWNEKRVLASIKRPNTQVLKAFKGSEFAGFGIMTFGKLKANLNLLAVHPPFRRYGIGAEIVTALEDQAVTLGQENFYVQVRESNQAAREFYRQFGYEMIDRNPRYYKNREAAVILYKYRPEGKS